MRKPFLHLLITGGLLLSASLPWLINQKPEAEVVEAESHPTNYAAYTYSGTYYDSLTADGEGMSGTLRKALTSLIHPTTVPSYSGGGTNHLSSVLQSADEDPLNKNNMIYLYTRDSVTKNAASSWNREHCWPQSLSNDCWGTGRAGADLLHIRPTYNTTNSTRGNDKYGEVDTSTGKKRTYNDIYYGYSGGGCFMPLDSVKGDVARIIMYVWTSYYDEYGSKLPDISKVFDSYDTLLTWHTNDKPDVLEGNRNDYAESSIQGNRNPFVDHPEYAWKIFGSKCSASVKNACEEAYPGAEAATLESIAVTTLPAQTSYYVSDTLNTAGMVVTGYYDNGSSKDVTSKCTFSPKTLSTVGTQQITVSYLGQTTSFSVEVNPRPTFTVTFNPNGGSGVMEPQVFSAGSSFTLPQCTFTPPTNHTFKAWSIAGREYAVGTKISVTADLEIFAVWKEKASEPIPETEVYISEESVRLKVGESVSLTGYSTDNGMIYWSIDKQNIELDKTGTMSLDDVVVTALYTDICTLTATNQYGVSATCIIEVWQESDCTTPEHNDSDDQSDSNSTSDSDSSSSSSKIDIASIIPGCGGYISASSAVIFLTSLIGVLFFIRKRRL